MTPHRHNPFSSSIQKNVDHRHFALMGFTQLELVVTLGIASLIVLSVGIWQADIFRFFPSLSQQLTSQHEARQTILTMVHELRTAVTADSGAFPLEIVGAINAPW